MPTIQVTAEKLISTPGMWGLWPYLPLKKLSNELGFILDSGLLIVYFINIYDIRKYETMDQIPQKQYNTVGELLDDGWLVD